jgi:parallel beta-helix repeat protein
MSYNFNEPLILLNVTGATIQGNWAVDNGLGMRLQKVYDLQVSFNTVTGGGSYINPGRYGIDVDTGTNVTVANNTVSNIPDGGVKCSGVQGARVTGNQISSNFNDGVLLMNSWDLWVLNNTIESNGDDGIFEIWGSGTFEVIGNYIANNVDSGIETSFAAEISWNTIANNGWFGVGLAGMGSTVHHNNIIGNLIQAYQDDGRPNVWDDGYPNGGNYWSDYAGVDLMQGPDQNLSGSDGIGDTPRSVPVGGQDRYPLMEPFDWDRPPVAVFEVDPSTGDTSTVFQFDASSSWDYETPTGDLMFRWDWDGDGTWDTDWSSNSTETHQFDTAGNYTVRLQVRDGNGTEAEYSLTIEVVEVIPEWSTVQMTVVATAVCMLVLAMSFGTRRRSRSRTG